MNNDDAISGALPRATSSVQLAIKDIAEGLKRIPLAWTMATEEARDKFARTRLGMFWVGASFLLFLGVKAVIFGQLNSGSSEEFFLFLAIGFSLWTLISAIVLNASTAYTNNVSWVLSTDLPYSFYFIKMLFRQIVDFVFVFVATAVLVIFLTDAHLAAGIWLIPAMVLYILMGFALSMLLAPVCVLKRDLIFALQSVIRILFFTTPIIWIPRPGTVLEKIALWNPIYHFIKLVREPLMQNTIPMTSWIICIAITLITLVAGFAVFSKTKRRLPAWL